MPHDKAAPHRSSTPPQQHPTAAKKEPLASFVRRVHSGYRNGPIRLGHSMFRRVFDPLLGKRQLIELRSGLKLSVDLTKGNQYAIFWNDGHGGLHLYWAIRELVPVGGLFVDVGANVGLIGLLACHYRQARVIFGEAHPRLAQTVSDNIKLNGFESSCEVIHGAITDQAGEITFFEDPINDGSHSIHEDAGGSKKQVLGKIKCVSLQEIIESRNLGKIDFLKIDTEGHDYHSLKSLGPYLRPDRVEVMFIEMSRDQRAMCDLLRGNGYEGFICTHFKRGDMLKVRRAYNSGAAVSVFDPIGETFIPEADVLWAVKGSKQAELLHRLHAAQTK